LVGAGDYGVGVIFYFYLYLGWSLVFWSWVWSLGWKFILQWFDCVITLLFDLVLVTVTPSLFCRWNEIVVDGATLFSKVVICFCC
jgi:hypothetical protein